MKLNFRDYLGQWNVIKSILKRVKVTSQVFNHRLIKIVLNINNQKGIYFDGGRSCALYPTLQYPLGL